MSITQPGPATPAARPLPIVQIAIAALVAILFSVIWIKTHPSANKYEVEASRITEAIIHNDMSPVASDFNAATRAKLSDRQKVARLSDDLNGLGKFQWLKEDTPAGSIAGFHKFQAHFEKATWNEDLSFGSDGKITAFHVRAPAETPAQ